MIKTSPGADKIEKNTVWKSYNTIGRGKKMDREEEALFCNVGDVKRRGDVCSSLGSFTDKRECHSADQPYKNPLSMKLNENYAFRLLEARVDKICVSPSVNEPIQKVDWTPLDDSF